MEDKREDYYSAAEMADFIKSFLRYLMKRWWLLLVFVTVGALAAIYYYKSQKPKYNGVTTFILEEKTGGGGGLAGLASQFGLSLGSMGGGESIFAGDNILNILRSKKVVEHVLLTRVESNGSDNRSMADLYIDFTGIKKAWQKKPALANISFSNKTTPLTPLEDSALNAVYERVIKQNLSTEKTSKQGTIYMVQVTARNRLFASEMARRLVAEASKMYLDIRVGAAQNSINNLQKRSDSLLALLNNRSYRAAASQPLDVNPGITTANVPTEIASRDKMVVATLYGEVTKNLEASKLLLSQQTPVIQILDDPGMSLKDNRKGLLLLLVVFCAAAVIIFVGAAFLLFYFKMKTGAGVQPKKKMVVDTVLQ